MGSNLAFGDGSGTSEVPIPDFDDFFAGLPSGFEGPQATSESGRPKVVAEGSRIINGDLARMQTRCWRETLNSLVIMPRLFVGRNGRARGKSSSVASGREPLEDEEDDYAEREMELMKGGMKDHAHAEATIPPIDGKIHGFWDPIPISPDTVETTTGFAGDDEEVNFPLMHSSFLCPSFKFDL
ncbi:hypothetical protein Bca52824_065237 [Brassica carinata]|uniref:Uncharacterized protein n=1 Tax=Brassica carinata TaxID=52824 RepID=A0A8X7QIC4_BRACI|nr:hypothetical protein Bca52824_065237 [Brassica carinata]